MTLKIIPLELNSLDQILACALLISALSIIFQKALHVTRRTSLPYPPGPPTPNFLLGHFGKLPMKKPWLDYMELSKKYGDLIYFRNLTQHIFILNSVELVTDLLGKQARHSSDRPLPFSLTLFPWKDSSVTMIHGEVVAKCFKVFHESFRAAVVDKYYPIQIEKVYNFLRTLASDQLGLSSHKLLDLSESIMITIIYGLNIVSNNEDLPQAAKSAVDAGDYMLLPGYDTWKTIPFVHILAKLGFFPLQRSIRPIITAIKEGPFQEAMKAMVGTLLRCLLSISNNFQQKTDSRPSLVGELTVSAISTFIFAMSLNPHVQTKAKEEINNVLGVGKIPRFSDRESLPYVEAIYREVMRWHPALPLGVPHKTTQALVYNGYYLPKGSLLFANIWAMGHNETIYPNPNQFDPERHLRHDGTFPDINSIHAYGFGRRICAGRYVADTTIWIAIACVLATMDITRSNDMHSSSSGVNVEDYYTDGGFWCVVGCSTVII
ncbi:cytochrome P450 [Dendrothele bispora CBS 962.96]|uniref:Cytochrome P450 n=1 Tax=Dendrothele bispora (strain CBS 962.96) TaxID=1314807 RepID=A0A4S8KWY3_DENBC|nr:cytochrome P450 [Dendrothele bispora CBS 962.96]